VSTEFSPAWFLPGPHFQTIWGRLVRPRRLVKLRREALETPDGDEVILDHLDTPCRADTPVCDRTDQSIRDPADRSVCSTVHFILLHGLEGSSQSVYMQGTLAAIARSGHSATAINFRSCAREPNSLVRMIPNRRPRFYHSGDTGDFDFVVRMLAARMPGATLVAFGASLGGNVLLKWLGEHPDQTLITAAATLSVPYDLGEGARHLETTAAGRFYVKRFLATLKKKVLREDIACLLDVERVKRARTFTEFDDAATAPLHGFRDAADYYERSSSIHYLGRIETPTLALNAVDDPFLPPAVLDRARAAASPAIDFRTTEAGGHVGFIGGRAPWNAEYWAEELVVRWLIERVRR
jgi:predicted alpha/beta-fold hydrolase